jgi:membrane-associated phospholipid phosphatase
MPLHDEELRYNKNFLKIKFSSARRLLSEAGLRYKITSFQSGFFWLLGYIVLSLVISRFIFWNHSWNFSWNPAGLASVLLLFFIVVHLGIGPFCVLFCDVIQEMRTNRDDAPRRSPLILLRDFAKKQYTMEYLLHGALAYCLVFGTLISYTNMKPAIPLLNHTLYDNLLFRCDSCVLDILSFGGLITLPKYSAVTVFFDTIYFQMWTLACITLVMSFPDRASYWRYTSAWCLAFGLSIPISILFPSLGPAFYEPDLFAHIGNTFSAEVMNDLWNNYQSFKMDPLNTSIVKGNGIVAMPSLHIALVYLSVIVLGKDSPRLRLILWGFLLLFIIATVYLGWHYLSDGIGGLLLGWFAYKISSQWFYEKVDQEA